MQRIIGIGETILDIIFRNDLPQTAVPGGSAFNAMISLGRTLGKQVEVSMITQTGSDHIGDIIENFMADNGVSTRFVTRKPDTKSHVSLAFLDQNNDAQYVFYKDHASATLEENSCSDLQFTADDILVFGSFFAINPVIREYTKALLKAARDTGATLYYDINFRKSHIKDLPDTLSNIIENCQLATYVRGSGEDFGYMLGTTDSSVILEKLNADNHLKGLIITNGSEPITVVSPGAETISFPVPQVETVSTIGAGDNFNAGFVYHLATNNNPHQVQDAAWWRSALTTATKFSSAVCQSYDNYVPKDFRI